MISFTDHSPATPGSCIRALPTSASSSSHCARTVCNVSRNSLLFIKDSIALLLWARAYLARELLIGQAIDAKLCHHMCTPCPVERRNVPLCSSSGYHCGIVMVQTVAR